ncbi:hypothetical protein Tco_0649958 [Tanacetum coccineum]
MYRFQTTFWSFYISLVLLVHKVTRPGLIFRCDPIWGCYSSTTTHADNSLPEYDSFLFETQPDQGELTSVVIEDILGEPRVYVPNVLPTHTTLMLNSDFIPSDDSLRSDLEVSFPSGTRNKIFDLGIFFEVQSMRFLSRDTFSISFIRDPLSPVFDTLRPFSYENEEKVFNRGSLASNEEKSPHLLAHRGFNPSKIISDFSKSPMMISGRDIPILDVLIAPDFEASRARGFVLHLLELQSSASLWESNIQSYRLTFIFVHT